MIRIACAALMFCAVLAGCVTPTPYGPAARPGGPGYAETAIESNRYRVTFNANAGGRQRAEDFALRRAAELTLQQGYDWFIVDQRYGASDRYGGSQMSVGVGVGSFGRRTGVSVGSSVGVPLGGGPPATATLEIRLGRGPKPESVQAYDARAVLQSLAGRT
jgi:hypothetical protein